MAEDTAAFLETYPNLADAATLQVVHRYRRRDSLGSTSMKLGTGEREDTGQYQLLDEVREAFDYYRRTTFA